MKKLFYPILALLPLLFQCKKEKLVTIHCENIVNDIQPSTDSGRIYVASAFTPNYDGLNDQFRPIAHNVKSISVKLYDKNSNLVFETHQLNTGWYPEPRVFKFEKYYYRVDGFTLQNNRISMCGEVVAFLCLPNNKTKNDFTFEDQFDGNGIGIPRDTQDGRRCN